MRHTVLCDQHYSRQLLKQFKAAYENKVLLQIEDRHLEVDLLRKSGVAIAEGD